MGLNFRKELTLGEVQVYDQLAFYRIHLLKNLLKSLYFPRFSLLHQINQPQPDYR